MYQARFTNLDLREADCRDLPFEDNTFDVLYNGYMLDLIPLADLAPVVAEFHRVLKPGGRLILLNMSKADDKITPLEKLYPRLPGSFVLYFFGICRPVFIEGIVKEAGFQYVARKYLEGVVASEIITAVKG